MKPTVAKNPPLVVHDVKEHLAMDFPPREVLLETLDGAPILTSQSINQIFAWRGTGKSMLSNSIAIALATGQPFLGWRATRKCKVLYLDGEMPDDQWKSRLVMLSAGKPFDAGYLRLITVGQQQNGIPALAEKPGDAVEAALEDSTFDRQGN